MKPKMLMVEHSGCMTQLVGHEGMGKTEMWTRILAQAKGEDVSGKSNGSNDPWMSYLTENCPPETEEDRALTEAEEKEWLDKVEADADAEMEHLFKTLKFSSLQWDAEEEAWYFYEETHGIEGWARAPLACSQEELLEACKKEWVECQIP